MENAITLQRVIKKYSSFKLDIENFELPKGTIMGLVGENGAGKTTLIKLILGLQRADEGEVLTMGKPCGGMGENEKEAIGVVFDECCFPENLTPSHVGRIMSGIYKNWEPKTYDNYMELFNLPKSKMIKDFSRGMKMKLSIAVALSHHARLLILDEATAGLDPVVRDEILEVFSEFIQDEEHSILISSHITSDLEKICDYITFIRDGKIFLTGVKDELMQEFGILKCSGEDFDKIDREKIHGYRRNSFGVNALVKRDEIKGEFIIDGATLEDILLYACRG